MSPPRVQNTFSREREMVGKRVRTGIPAHPSAVNDYRYPLADRANNNNNNCNYKKRARTTAEHNRTLYQQRNN